MKVATPHLHQSLHCSLAVAWVERAEGDEEHASVRPDILAGRRRAGWKGQEKVEVRRKKK